MRAGLRVRATAGGWEASCRRADGARVVMLFERKADAMRWLKANRGG